MNLLRLHTLEKQETGSKMGKIKIGRRKNLLPIFYKILVVHLLQSHTSETTSL